MRRLMWPLVTIMLSLPTYLPQQHMQVRHHSILRLQPALFKVADIASIVPSPRLRTSIFRKFHVLPMTVNLGQGGDPSEVWGRLGVLDTPNPQIPARPGEKPTWGREGSCEAVWSVPAVREPGKENLTVSCW
jgi:hypothetical protein